MKTVFNEQVKKRAKGIERENPANIPEKGNNYKGPEAEMCLAYFRNMETSITRAQ